MQPIASPIAAGDSGPHVANLQEGLRVLLDRSVDSLGSPTADELVRLTRAGQEQVQWIYGEVTTIW